MVLAAPEEGDSPRSDEAPVQDVVVVRAYFRLAGAFLKAGLRSAGLHGTAAQNRRRDTVEHGRLMELHERICVEPVPARGVLTVDERDVRIRVVDQRVRERHAHRAGTDDEVVGGQLPHRHPRPEVQPSGGAADARPRPHPR